MEKRTRSSVVDVIYSDLSSNSVFKEGQNPTKFHIVICSLVWDVVAVNPSQLETVIKRSMKCLEEDGILVVQGSLHEDRYTVGSAVFPVLNIDKDTLWNTFQKCQLEVVKWETRVKCSTHYFTILKRESR